MYIYIYVYIYIYICIYFQIVISTASTMKAGTRQRCDISLQDYFNGKEVALGLEF